MNIITVIPLARTKGVNELSYFTASDVPVGALVTVPVRSKNVSALVTTTRPAFDIKAEIKNAPYALKKLERVRATHFFPAAFVHSCKKLADYYAADIGSIIDALVSDTLLENASKIAAPGNRDSGRNRTSPSISSHSAPEETYAVQGDDEDRTGSWRSLIRQEFARKRSVAIYVPTIEDAKNISATLTKGIEGYIFTLHSKLPKKQLIETWESIANTKHSIVVVATGSFAVLPRADIDTIIIERENGRGWIGAKLPYIDMRHALETIARDNGQTVYRADSLLRTETLHRTDGHEIAQGSPFKWRSVSLATDALIDMKQGTSTGPKTYHDADQIPEEVITPKFRVLSKDLEELIQYNKSESTHLFILAIRRGSSPITVCSDCDTVVSCKNCSGPVVLHTSGGTGKNFFMCHRCGERRTAVEVCITCGGWRLAPLGIGIDKVYEDIKERFPDIDIFKIDADSAKTDTQIADTLEKFKTRPGSILLGTEMALVYLTEKIDHIAIASLDSLFALPDFRIHEKIMHLLIRLRSLARRSFLVQTRKAEEKVFEYGLKGNLSDFYRSTLDDRKQFSYPPYSTLIKITIEGKKDAIAAQMAEVQRLLEPREIDIFPAFTATVRGNSIIHGLLKLPQGGWPNTDLLSKLRQLPPSVKVKVDPESLL
ncbi:MAG: hypothetical protein KBC33_01130 [Candidatus Pacebacteria bacterium]|nr:hypothetical protein [Candidatus Paceibacterota bacterium]